MEIQITTQSSYKTPFPYHVAAHGLIFEPERYFNECHASTIERYPDGDLATAWFAGTREKNPNTAIWFSLCRKGSWSEPKKVADCPGIRFSFWTVRG